MHRLRKFVSTHQKFLFSIGFLVIFSFAVSYAAPLYTPGQTLNPTCAPGTTNCTVSVGGSVVWSTITGTPTTLGGYGVTDAYTKTASDARYQTPITFSTGFTNTSGTVTNNLLTGITGGQTIIGGTGITDILSLKGTTANGTTTSSAINFKVGNNGATIAATILNNGNVGIGTNTPGTPLEVNGAVKAASVNIGPANASTITVGTPTGLTASILYNQGQYNALSNSFNYRVYAYKNINSNVSVFSSSYATLGSTLFTDNSFRALSIHLSWNPVAGADGYIVLINSDAMTTSGAPYDPNYQDQYITTSTSLTDDGGGNITFDPGSSVFTPTSYTGFSNTNTINGMNNFNGLFTVTGTSNFIGNIGINTASPLASFDLEGDGAVLAAGTLNSGVAIPDLGGSTRMMWIPKVSAFRAGTVTGTNWDSANVGVYSAAFGLDTTALGAASAAFGDLSTASGPQSFAAGYNTTASGSYSAAFGFQNTAGSYSAAFGLQNTSGLYATVFGNNNTASGNYSGVWGQSNIASGISSSAFGNHTTASGDNSTALGYSTVAQSGSSTAIGVGNIGGGTASQNSWVITDPLFEVGNGNPTVIPLVRSDAFIVLKNANTGIGLGATTPSYLLQVGSSGIGNTGIVARFQNSTGTCDINPTTTSLSCSSDMTLKKNISNLADNSTWSFNANITRANQSIFDKVLALNPVDYNWNTETDLTTKHPGFIAQEVQQVFPDLVATDPTTHLLSLNYTGLIPYTVEAIKEMNINVTSIDDLTKTNSWRDAIIAWLGDAGNGITSIFSTQVTTPTLCVGTTTNKTCITKTQLDTLLNSSSAGAAPQGSPTSSSGSQGSAQTPDATPPVVDTVPPADVPPASTQSPE